MEKNTMNMKKIRSLVIACLIMALLVFAVGAAAADSSPSNQSEQFAGLVSCEEVLAHRESSMCFVPHNPGSGTTGEIAIEFVAVGESATFTVDCKSEGLYHFQPYCYDDGVAVKIGSAERVEFGYGPTFTSLVDGAIYYIVTGSLDVPAGLGSSGIGGTYTLDVR